MISQLIYVNVIIVQFHFDIHAYIDGKVEFTLWRWFCTYLLKNTSSKVLKYKSIQLMRNQKQFMSFQAKEFSYNSEVKKNYQVTPKTLVKICDIKPGRLLPDIL